MSTCAVCDVCGETLTANEVERFSDLCRECTIEDILVWEDED